ncbi:glycerophosphoryl diester phosphodiesterase [Natrinema pellirubrum DSM 15624]|uniref:Glycerophosphoryl diester phosphodiesterase n=1 Tax=Natrinema pellirubrum (strain DSM 15624 / CIP 106293 / JCM 10476 / NCIMB 786 / 157) TaxID=797303 RepID=L0JFX9_NATP1|nr:glycerophosphodiester phosphodiesterase [Natrinema pellirubrum]AGB30214.1 glycerophosphoryl diester phosphodiesterase [Natrinema pellirubrum DSM 15624]ELY78652.1 glycerophosphoryl diester phosphodiesterase [Natrinema pellirubrum DSM 15624]
MVRPAVIAHRGYAGVAPENTIAAAERAAARDGTVMLEIDVRPAACGTPVVVHDERLDGTRDGRPLTDATGLVRETPLEELQATRVLGTDATVPSLAALLEAVPESVGVNVELKSPGTADLRTGEALPPDDRDRRRRTWRPFVERVVADCEAFGGDLLFSSFCEGAIAALREVADYAAAPLVGEDLAAGLEIASRYDCEAIHPPRTAILDPESAEPATVGDANDGSGVDLLERAHEAGRAVNVWTVRNWVQFDRLAAAGVDGIIADYPGLGAAAGDR